MNLKITTLILILVLMTLTSAHAGTTTPTPTFTPTPQFARVVFETVASTSIRSADSKFSKEIFLNTLRCDFTHVPLLSSSSKACAYCITSSDKLQKLIDIIKADSNLKFISSSYVPTPTPTPVRKEK